MARLRATLAHLRSHPLRAVLAWGLAVPFVIWAIARLFGLERGYPLVPLISYTPYIAAAAVVPVAIAFVLRRPWPLLAAGLAAAYLIAVVAPRALPDGSIAAGGGPTLRIVSLNIHLGAADLESLVALVREREADVLVVQELTPQAVRRLEALGLRETLPHAVISTERKNDGGGIYSRHPLSRQAGAPFGFRMPRATLRLDGSEVEITCVHAFPPNSATADLWREGLEALPAAGEQPIRILAGDFNATLDHAELRDVLGRGYRDAADVLGKGLTSTWPVGRFFPPPVTIDHVLVDERVRVEGLEIEEISGSDHKTLVAELELPR